MRWHCCSTARVHARARAQPRPCVLLCQATTTASADHARRRKLRSSQMSVQWQMRAPNDPALGFAAASSPSSSRIRSMVVVTGLPSCPLSAVGERSTTTSRKINCQFVALLPSPTALPRMKLRVRTSQQHLVAESGEATWRQCTQRHTHQFVPEGAPATASGIVTAARLWKAVPDHAYPHHFALIAPPAAAATRGSRCASSTAIRQNTGLSNTWFARPHAATTAPPVKNHPVARCAREGPLLPAAPTGGAAAAAVLYIRGQLAATGLRASFDRRAASAPARHSMFTRCRPSSSLPPGAVARASLRSELPSAAYDLRGACPPRRAASSASGPPPLAARPRGLAVGIPTS